MAKLFIRYVQVHITLCLLLKSATQEKAEKRILLNDPDYTVQQEINQLKSQIQQLTAKPQGGGTVYTRWGRRICSGNTTELVYHGYVGGSHYTHAGAATNYVCLTSTPTWAKYDDHVSNSGGLMYGAEYEDGFFHHIHDDDAPCAVCRNTVAMTSLMIPGQNVCPSGWNLEYHGYLASGHFNQPAGSEFVCLDSDPEILDHSQTDENGKLFYQVEGICGSLPCPPYVNGRELTCAVCSK